MSARKTEGADVSYDAAEAAALAWIIPLGEAEIARLERGGSPVVNAPCGCPKCQRLSSSDQQ